MLLKITLGLALGLAFSATPLATDYFPKQTGLSDFETKWFTGPLIKAKEPSLLRLSHEKPAREVYRVVICPPFSWMIVFRLEVEANGTGILILNEVAQDLESPVGVTGPIRRKGRFVLTATGVQHFKEQLARFDFWNQPARVKEPMITDATEIIYEGVRGDNYQIIVRAPEKSDSVALPAFYLLNLVHEAVDDF